jgi:diguanylate cyclase (GGDEF)-like protein
MCALDPHRTISQYLHATWTTSTGLPQTSVYTIAQTTDGYLWVGTESGLARFDGVRFTIFDRKNTPALPADYISRMLGGSDGSLWIGTDSGLVRRKNGTWTVYTTKEGLPGDEVRALLETADGSIWVGTNKGLAVVQSGVLRAQSPTTGMARETVNALASADGRNLWVATAAGVTRLASGRATRFAPPRGWGSAAPMALAWGPDRAMWVGCQHGRLYRIGDGVVTDKSGGLPDSDINALTFDKDRNLWIGLQSRGLGRLFDGQLTLQAGNDELTGNTVESVFLDTENNLWVGTFDAGLERLRDGLFATYGKPEGFSSNIGWCAIESREGALWMATNTGTLDRRDRDGRVRNYTVRDGLPGEVIHSMLEAPDGTIWLGHRHGVLTRMREGRFTVYKDPYAGNFALNSLLLSSAGELLVGSYGGGVARFENGHFAPVTTSGSVPAMAEAPDRSLWLGTDGTGVVHLRNGQPFEHFTSANGLLSNHVAALTVDKDGTVWVGTESGGLNRIRNGRVTSYNEDRGLFDSSVGNIQEDASGYLWLGSDNGIFRVAKQELNEFAEGKIATIHGTVYDTADGLRSRETMQGGTGTASKGQDGRFWFSTMGGLSVVDTTRVPGEEPLPKVHIEEVYFDNKLQPSAQAVRIGPGSGRLAIHFTAPSFAMPQKVSFRYRLSGFERAWSRSTTQRAADYTNLPPGAYDFEVQATTGLSWSPPASVRIVVLPPWYRTPPAYLAAVLLPLLLGWGMVRVRTRTLRRRHRVLEGLVKERTAQLEAEKQELLSARLALQYQADHDALTGLLNHGAIIERLAQELERAHREKAVLTVVLGDLDHFKKINDTYGHLIGDKVLFEVAKRLSSAVRGYDLVGRYGGEEFLILLPHYDALRTPDRVELLLQEIAARSFDLPGCTMTLTCSLGVTVFPSNAELVSVDEIVRRADRALYRAKNAGRNRIEVEAPETLVNRVR